tara:strand:- start:589 stop:849 length:261 start_codon:yes stop_codon:yes gene_type:complete
MLDEVIVRLIQGVLSGIGLGTVFYFYPIIRHIIDSKYRVHYRFNNDENYAFKKETHKYFKLGLSYGFIYGFLLGTIIGPYGSIVGV